MKKVLYLVLCLFIGVSTYAQQKKTVKRKAVKSYTTEQAVVYAEDYFEFYEANTPYRSPPIARKISNNVFHIKIEVCTCYPKSYCYNDDERDCWQAKIYTLTIANGGKYGMEEKFNY